MAKPDVTAGEKSVVLKAAYTKVSYELLHRMLDLPHGVKITSILQQPEDRANENVRLYLQGEEIAEVEDGHSIPEVIRSKMIQVELVPVKAVESAEPVSP